MEMLAGPAALRAMRTIVRPMDASRTFPPASGEHKKSSLGRACLAERPVLRSLRCRQLWPIPAECLTTRRRHESADTETRNCFLQNEYGNSAV